LGQLLEYAYFKSAIQNAHAELVIVAPGPMTEDVSDYINRLKTKFSIPVKYCSFSLGNTLPEIFTAIAGDVSAADLAAEN
jgi:hypothetical protein